MKKDRDKEKFKAALGKMVEAARELVRAEQSHDKKTHKPPRRILLGARQ